VLLLAASAFAGVARAGADAEVPPPSISSEKADYAPGETVTLSGSNWASGESVHIVVNDDAGQTWRRDVDVNADADGHVTDQFALPDWFVAVYSVSATGAQSGTATTTFTDGNVSLHLAAAEGVASMTVSFARFDGSNASPNTNCSGAPSVTGTVNVTSGATANIPGFGGSTDSVRLTSVTTPTAGKAFDNWTSGTKTTDSGTLLPGSPTPCISNGSGGTNGNVTDAYAHFKDANHAPTASAGGPYAVAEGGAVALSGSGSDSDGDPLAYEWDLDNNGTFETPGQNPSFSAAAIDGPATRTVTLRVSDGKGGSATSSATVSVTNVAPTATFTAPASVNEGSSFAVSLTGASDPSSADTAAGFTYAFDCGSGYGAFGSANSTSCSTDDNGSRSVKGKVRDQDGGFTEYTAAVAIQNAAPTGTLGNNGPKAEGSAVSVSFSGVSDPSSVDAASLHYAFDCAGGSLAGVTYAAAGTSSSTTCTFDDNGSFGVSGLIIDKDGGRYDATTTVTVTNVAPTATLGDDGPVDEGSSFHLTLAGADDVSAADRAAGFTYAFDCGDGSGYGAFGSSASETCATSDDGSRSVKGKIRDKDGGVGEYTGTVVVENVVPTVTLTAPASAGEGGLVAFSYSWTDPGTADTFPAAGNSVACGPKGIVSDKVFTPASRSGSFKCTFTDDSGAGTFAVTATVTDDDGGAGSDTTQIDVNNAPPAVTLSGPVSADEGDAVSYSYSWTDPGSADTFPAAGNAVDCGPKGTASDEVFTPASRSGSFKCTFTDDSGAGTLAVTATITDDDGGVGSDTEQVAVANVAPTASFGDDGPVDEGSPFHLTLADADDASAADRAAGFTYAFDCGDGSGYGPFGSSASAACSTNDDGSRSVKGRVRDKDGGVSEYTGTVVVENVAPTVSFTAGPASVSEDESGSELYTFSVSDPGADGFTVKPGFPECGTGGALVSGSLATTASGGSFRCRFADGPASPTVRVQVVDADEPAGSSTADSNVATRDVTVANVAPTVNLGGPTTADEGETKTYSFTLSDPGDDTFAFPSGYPSCGAYGELVGSPTVAGGGFQCRFPDGPHTTTVAVKVADDDGGVSSPDVEQVDIIPVAVANVAPEVTAPADHSADEGESTSYGLGSFSDPGSDSPWTVDVDWGDGSSEPSFQETATGAIAAKSHSYADNGSYTVTVTVTDKDGAADSATFTVTVANVAPSVALSGPAAADEGDTVSYSYSWTDPGSADTFPAAGNAVDCGPQGTPSDEVFTPASKSGSFKCTFSDDSGAGTFAVSATVADDDGGAGSDTEAVSVANVAPSVSLSGATEVDEGTTHTYSFSVSDPGDDDFAVVGAACGDNGTYEDGSLVSTSLGGSFACTFADGPASSDVTVRVEDSDGASDADSEDVVIVQVANVTPVVTAPAGQSSDEGETVSFALGSFVDPGADSPWAVDVDWGDGSAHTAFTGAAAGAIAAKSHAYDDNGSYTLTVEVTDDDGASDAKSFQVTVANVAPTAAFGDDGPVDEGSSFHLALTGADDVSAADRAAGFTYAFDCGDGSGYGAFGSSASATCSTADDGVRAVKGKIRDKDGGVREYGASVTVRNVAPTVTLSGPSSASEGDAAGYTYSWSDPGSGDSFPIGGHSVGCGPKGYASAEVFTPATKRGSFTCTFGDDSGAGTFAVGVTVTDDDGGAGSDTKQVSVANVAPTASNGSFALDPVYGTATAGFDFRDAGWLDAHGASFFTWSGAGDRPAAVGEENVAPDATGHASDTRTLTPGCYGLTVSGTAKDDDGGTSAALPLYSSAAASVHTRGFRPPIVDNERNVAKYGNVVPVKVVLTNACTGASVTSVPLFITIAKGVGNEAIEDTNLIAESVSSADTGNQMRTADGMYIFNLTTKNLTAGSDYTIRIRPGSATAPYVLQAVLYPKK
jgi:hypothetical protein